ncbi:hypothetical protein E3N88_31431 [Mikania micrantha]|uniref:Uncharacterized protein n=1 Tax=Mikania micrantha TaxID=192012 RepID=A0A5N6MRR0_9ASTR|nr:hypothetical protein E3N88_31431 [Mikania micrantha]
MEANERVKDTQEKQELWSWGAGTEGQLGTGKLQDEHVPQLIHILPSLSLLSCGGAHVIALFHGMHTLVGVCVVSHVLYLYQPSLHLQEKRCLLEEEAHLVNMVMEIRMWAAFYLWRWVIWRSMLAVSVQMEIIAQHYLPMDMYTLWGRGFDGDPDVCCPNCVISHYSFKKVALGWNHALGLTDEGDVLMLGGSHHGILNNHQKEDLNKDKLKKIPSLNRIKVVEIASGSEHSVLTTGKHFLSSVLATRCSRLGVELCFRNHVNIRFLLILRNVVTGGRLFPPPPPLISGSRHLSNAKIHCSKKLIVKGWMELFSDFALNRVAEAQANLDRMEEANERVKDTQEKQELWSWGAGPMDSWELESLKMNIFLNLSIFSLHYHFFLVVGLMSLLSLMVCILAWDQDIVNVDVEGVLNVGVEGAPSIEGVLNVSVQELLVCWDFEYGVAEAADIAGTADT